MTEVSVKKEYLSGEKTEIEMLESVLESGSSKISCFVFDFKALSKNDLAQILVALERWIINNYKPELHPRWDREKNTYIAYFDTCHEKMEGIALNILSLIKGRNQKVRTDLLIKESEEKTKLLKEAKEKGKEVPQWVDDTVPHTCSEKCESESTLIEEYGFPQ